MEGENFIKGMIVFSLNNGLCMIQERRCRIQVTSIKTFMGNVKKNVFTWVD